MSKAEAREAYYDKLIAFQAWRESRELSFPLEMAAMIEARMKGQAVVTKTVKAKQTRKAWTPERRAKMAAIYEARRQRERQEYQFRRLARPESEVAA